MRQAAWFYRNYLPKTIPENLEELSEAERQETIAKWTEAVHTKNTQSRDDKLRNIRDLRRIHLESVPVWVLDTFKGVIDHYVTGQWLSSITLAGIIAEFLSFYLIEQYVKSHGILKLIKHSRGLGNQAHRLKVLRELGVLTAEELRELDLVRTKRNEYMHLDKISTGGRRIKADSLLVVTNLTNFLNKHRLLES
jgi:hypothetical protein